MRNKKRFISVMTALVMVFSTAIPAMAAPVITVGAHSSAEATASTTVASISKYGNIELVVTSDELTNAGFATGDMVTVTINDVEYEMPFCTNYSDVDNGALVLRAEKGTNAIIAINMGNFAGTYGVEAGAAVDIRMKEAGAYLEEYEIRNLVRTNNRSDYSSDVVYANFRMVNQGNIADGVLYRSSSPINEEINRASYADTLAAAAGIHTFINLADSETSLEEHFSSETFASPYYMSVYEDGGVILLNMAIDFNADDFRAKLATGLNFMADQDGPYLVHCNEGKDRAGFTIAVLQALMGANVDEIVEDYMETYENYYGVQRGTTKYDKIAEGNIKESLRSICGLESGASLDGVDLSAATESYLTSIGMSQSQIQKLKTKLSTGV
ncbi:MAG: tyrosine-protein phosphatase [Lachnospiraceae bacterium]